MTDSDKSTIHRRSQLESVSYLQGYIAGMDAAQRIAGNDLPPSNHGKIEVLRALIARKLTELAETIE